MTNLRAGILVTAATCIHCSRPIASGAVRCGCGPALSRPRRGFAETFFTAGGAWS